MQTPFRIIAVSALAATIGGALACSSKSGPGQLSVALVDAPNPAVEEIWVNVTAVRAHEAAAGWITVSTAPVRVDLLTLKDHAVDLGLTSLPAGKVTQLRLLVSKDGNTVKAAGVEYPLVVPSGTQSGIKINGPWTIGSCTTTAVTLDFDGARSIWTHPTGQGTEWILRPVIRTKKAEHVEGTCEEPPPTCVPAECGSGACDPLGEGCAPGGTGSSCALPESCLSGVCDEGTCAPGGPGAPCNAGGDCTNGTCDPDGLCAPGGAGGAGTACTADSQCLSSTCAGGICQPGGQGAPCVVDPDCATGFTCTAGSCAEGPNPL